MVKSIQIFRIIKYQKKTDSIFKMGKHYYTKVFLEECLVKLKEKKINIYIYNDMEISSDGDGSSKEYFEEEVSNKEAF